MENPVYELDSYEMDSYENYTKQNLIPKTLADSNRANKSIYRTIKVVGVIIGILSLVSIGIGIGFIVSRTTWPSEETLGTTPEITESTPQTRLSTPGTKRFTPNTTQSILVTTTEHEPPTLKTTASTLKTSTEIQRSTPETTTSTIEAKRPTPNATTFTLESKRPILEKTQPILTTTIENEGSIPETTNSTQGTTTGTKTSTPEAITSTLESKRPISETTQSILRTTVEDELSTQETTQSILETTTEIKASTPETTQSSNETTTETKTSTPETTQSSNETTTETKTSTPETTQSSNETTMITTRSMTSTRRVNTEWPNTNTSLPGCRSTEFKCNDEKCISEYWICDGYKDCAGGEDEFFSSCTGCRSTEFKCNDEKCISEYWICDGYKDCAGGEDEFFSSCKPCPNGGMRCPTDNSCIKYSMICDRINDCPDGSDEMNCTIGCRPTEFTCNDGGCIDRDWTCDGKKDCAGGEDETLYSCNKCRDSQFQCVGVDGCFNSTYRCDGITHCNDDSDEAQCVNTGADGPSKPGDSTRPVQMTYKGEQGFSLCADNWNKTWSDLLCKQLGYKESQETNLTLEVQTSDKLLHINTSTASYLRTRNLITSLSKSGSCPSNRLVGVSCKLLECGIRKVSNISVGPYIVNGQEATRGAWPWQVHLELSKSDGRYYCGGSLINNRWILTAAHCLERVRYPSNITVNAGSTIKSGTDPRSRILKVDRKISHPSYENLLNERVAVINDVALLKLSSPIVFTETVAPVCLAPPDVDLKKFKVCVATGWGRTRFENTQTPIKLRQGRMVPRSVDECYRAYRTLPTSIGPWRALRSDFNHFFCAGNIPATGGVDTCMGDSGGPLVCQDQNDVWSVVGVTSFRIGYCNMSVFAKVSYYNSWIMDQMAI